MAKKKLVPTEKTRVRVELQFYVETEVYDPEDMAEISRQVVEKFSGQVRRHEIGISDHMVKTEIVT